MHMRRAVYRAATVVVALAFLTAGITYLARPELATPVIVALGYPVYLITVLGVWKVLGGLVIAAPGLPRLKEWAYAGITFDLTGACISHLATGRPAGAVLPLALLAVTAVSWAFMPPAAVFDARPDTPSGERVTRDEEWSWIPDADWPRLI